MFPDQEENYYWDLTLKGGRVIPIPPRGVPVVHNRMENREPVKTTTMTIPFSEIKGFERTARRFTQLPLLEDVARAFDEPVYSEDGSIKARWVKKLVTQSEYNTKYSKGSYKRLNSEDGMIWVAFAVPVHKIDFTKVSYLTEAEERQIY